MSDDPLGCADVHELVWLAIDDELSSDERAALDAHLLTCASCRSKIEKARRNAAALKSMPVPEVPAGFAERTLRRLDAPAPLVRFGARAQMLAAAAVIVVLIGAWYATRPSVERLGADEVASAPSRPPPPAESAELRANDDAPARLDDEGRSTGVPIGAAGDPSSPTAQAPGRAEAPVDAVLKQARDDAEPEGAPDAGTEKAKVAERFEAGDKVEAEPAPAEEEVASDVEELGYSGGDADEADALKKDDAFGATGSKRQSGVAFRNAATPEAALELLLARTAADERAAWKEDLEKPPTGGGGGKAEGAAKSGAPTGPGERRRGAVGGAGGDKNAEQRKDADTKSTDAKETARRQLEEPASIGFFAVRDEATVAAWLRERPGAATREGLTVVDVPESALAELLASLEGKKAPAERLEPEPWLDRVATARAKQAKLDSTTASRAAPKPRPDALPPPGAPTAEKKAPGDIRNKAEKSNERALGDEQRDASRMIRVVLWVEPREPGEKR